MRTLQTFLAAIFVAAIVMSHVSANAQTIYYGGICASGNVCASYSKQNLCEQVMKQLNTPTTYYSSAGFVVPYSTFPEGACTFMNLAGASKGQRTIFNGIATTCPSTCDTPTPVNSEPKSGLFTPTLTFNGLSSGITYSIQQGEYQEIGDAVFAQVYIQLSSKGTSTGTASITGLPFTPTTAFSSQCAGGGIVSGAAGLSGYTGQIAVNICQTNAYLLADVAPGETLLTNANFSNTSTIIANFMYFKQ